MNSKIRRVVLYFLAFLTLLGVWSLCAHLLDSPLILPAPENVFLSLKSLCKNSFFYKSLFLTFTRVFWAFAFSAVAGLVLGVLSSEFETVKIFLSIPLSFIRSTPVVAIILIAVFWVGSEKVPAFVAFLMGLPVVITNVENGWKNTDKKLVEMSRVFKFTRFRTLFFVRAPSIFSGFKAALVSSFGMAWKVVVAGEVLALPKKSVGFHLYQSQIHLETAEVFAWTICIVALSFIGEKILKAIVKLLK